MVATFSPHRDAGGTLHLPSPTGIHHVDASSAIRQLRRSLSRSPSKSSDFRLLPRISPQTSSIPFISSPLSPSRRANQGSLLLLPMPSTSPVAIPYPPSAKINRPIVRRAGSLQIARTRTSPKSPSKRPLIISSDQGNTPPRPPSFTPPGEENQAASCGKPTDDKAGSESTGDFCMVGMMGNSPAPKPITGRIEKRRSGNLGSLVPAVSPLKRSDDIVNLDHAGIESPSAKRRSLHAASFGSDFSIFDSNEGERADVVPREDTAQSGLVRSPSTSPFATIPKRSSSLRKSTLQQRPNDRPFFSRPRLNPDSFESPPKSPALFMRHRLSLDGDLSLPSGFESAIPSQSAFSSSHSVFSLNQTGAPHAPPAAHPLSHTITQSSASSLADDSPTQEHTLKDDRPKGVFGFSKSLPPGAIRPGATRQLKREDSTSSSDSFATPENYRLVKPLPAAFMSTGLISKKNRNAEDSRNLFGSSKNMPDTPCKRPTNFPTAQKALPLGPIRKPKLVRQSNAVVPSTPFNRQDTHPTPSPFARGTGLFGSVFNKPAISRRSSFVSTDGDEQSLSQSPSARHESQTSAESDLPPTPTKQPFYSTSGQFTFGSRMLPIASHERLSDPKGSSPSPLNDPSEHTTPQTPKESIFPPDPSGLSISAPNESPLNKDNFNSSGFTIPATPTGPREYFMPAGKRASFPLGSYSAPDVDLTLTSRFVKVELIGTGEFSQVYRVSKPQSALPYNSFSLPTTSPSTLPERVWAIKKAKHPYAGVKDRQRRIREVEILKALVNSDHVISFVDSWEDRGYLYIQTEFCEEGSLDVFLAQEGLKARLDDFRIWKILLELSWGLKHIHNSGFIHLDLKPANVLITFEGVLKIADFGMATKWPAEDGIEGEGDREYIGPEVLMGRYDKPADIFALGLILFEIAGNVELPDNGLSWQKLRNGDMSDVPSLTWSSVSSVVRDASGNPMSEALDFEELSASYVESDFESSFLNGCKAGERKALNLARSGELLDPPCFMVDAAHEHALDKIVHWMISPEPENRPTADQVLQCYGVQWAEHRRRAGATIFEGNWGPADEVLVEDAEMIDV